MSANVSGTVKLTVDVRGTGDAPKKLQETTKAAKALEAAGGEAGKGLSKTAREMAGVESQTGGLVGKVGTLREQFLGMSKQADEGVLKLKEGFGKITEAAGVIGTVVGAVGAGLVALFDMIARDRTLERLRKDFDATLTKAQDLRNKLSGLTGGLAAGSTSQYERDNARRARERAAAEAAGDTDRLGALERDQRIADAREAADRAVGRVSELTTQRDEARAAVEEARRRQAELAAQEEQFQKRRLTLSADDIKRQTDAMREQAALADEILKGERALADFEAERAFAAEEAAAARQRWQDARDPAMVFDPLVITPRPRGGGGGGARAANDNAFVVPPAERSLGAVYRDLLEEDARLAREWANTLGHDVAASILEGYEEEIQAAHDEITRLESLLAPDMAGSLHPKVVAHLRGELERLKAEYETLEAGPSGEQMRLDIRNAREMDGLTAEARRLVELQDQEGLGGWVRDFSSALSDALPNMGAFASALSTISAEWDGYARGQRSIGQAVTGSVAAIARAGAEHIKSERTRAGVLAVIETGLGIASLAIMDYPAAAAHFLAAATLGTVALTGAASAGSASSSSRNVMQTTASSFAQPAPQVNIYGGWIGNGSPQENADALWDRMRASQGTGYGWRGAA